MEDWSSRIALSFVTACQIAAWASENPHEDKAQLTLLDDRVVDCHNILRADEFGCVLAMSFSH
jgi:hypothetical protein